MEDNNRQVRKTARGLLIHYPQRRRMTLARIQEIERHAHNLEKTFGTRVYGVYVEEDKEHPGRWFRISYAFDRK